jgi:hypothetical protein
MAKELEPTAMLDRPANEVINGITDDKPLRIVIWNKLMEKNGHSTDETVVDMKPVLDMSDDQITDFVTNLI